MRTSGRAVTAFACVCAAVCATQSSMAFARTASNAGGRGGQPSVESYHYYMDAVRYRTKLCVGDVAEYTMAVYRQSTSSADRTALYGVKVEGYPNDSAVATFIGKTKVGVSTSWTSPDGSDFASISADFKLKAGKKPGKTTLVFQGSVRGVDALVGYVSFNIDIKVVQCKFKVSGTLRFPPDSSGDTSVPFPPLVARIKPVQLDADDEGHLTGSATIHWVSASATASVGGISCTNIETFSADAQVKINGDTSEDGVLTLSFVFPQASGLISMSCAGIPGGSGSFPYLPDQLTVDVPSRGGTFDHAASYNDDRFPGVAIITVKPIKPS
jgi:hypothetical protein